MILSKNPVQGGSVVIRVSFKDESGQVYVPVEGAVFFALLAQNNDKEHWEVVKPWEPVAAASVVDIVLQGEDLEFLPDCTSKRRIVLQWKYLRGGEEVVGRDQVDFEISALPITFPPLGPPPPLPSPDPAPLPSPDPGSDMGPFEDTIDGLEAVFFSRDISIKVADGFIMMSRGTVLAEDAASGLWAFVYVFSAPNEVHLIGVHGDTHAVSQPLFRAALRGSGSEWTIVWVDENELGLEAGEVFDFH
jgi:hypothetical protein